MLRSVFAALVALFVMAGLTFAADKADKAKAKKKGQTGTVKSFDDKTYKLVVAVKKKKETKDVDVDIKDLKVTDEKGEVIEAKAYGEKLKEGTLVTLSMEDGKVTGVSLGGPKKKKKADK